MKNYTNIVRLFSIVVLLFLTVLLKGQPSTVVETEQKLLKQAAENIEKYRKGEAVFTFIDEKGKPVKNVVVTIRQTGHDFLLGCIIFDLIRNETIYREEMFKQQFRELFNFAVFPYYWPGYERVQGMPSWERFGPVLEWCKANNITTKGHPLVWACRSGAPQWLKQYEVSETEELLKSRVINITGGFRGKVDIWDVVNEPINVKTWSNKMATFDDPNDWGVEDPINEVADYVEKSLQWAYTGNPSAQLIINEYRTIADQKVRKRFDELLEELNKRKAPISGVGIQGHEPRQEWFNPREVWNTFDLLSRHGHPLHITEFHPQSSGVDITGGWRTGQWTEDTQAEFAEQFIRLCFGHPAVASVNFWGFSDRNIWLPGGGLIDEEYRPKKIYNVLLKMFNEEWRTNETLKTDSKGAVSLRGFYGTYEVELTLPNGRTKTWPVSLRKDEGNKWEFNAGPL